MHDYLAPGWNEVLKHNGLGSFDAIWALKADWFEPPNKRRGGWSGVVRLEVRRLDGGIEVLFIKRQENHQRRTFCHPLAGEPTFKVEIKNINRLKRIGVPTLDEVYYAQRKLNGRWRAILITRELKGFQSLERLMEVWPAMDSACHYDKRRRLIATTAALIRRLHSHRLVHGTLYPKHLFIRLAADRDPEICLIDLEKMRFAWTSQRAARCDLDCLNRRAQCWSQCDRLRFFKEYMGSQSLSKKERAFWGVLAQRRHRFLEEHLISG